MFANTKYWLVFPTATWEFKLRLPKRVAWAITPASRHCHGNAKTVRIMAWGAS